MNKLFYTTLIVALVSTVSISAQNITRVTELCVDCPSSYDLPEGVEVLINGTLIITDDPSESINNEYLADFAVFSKKGVVMGDLGIGDESLWLNNGIPDYVFEPDYELPSLKELESYVKQFKHLPGVIGQDELNDQGYYMVNKMLMGQLKNLEELLLHTINQEKEIVQLAEENKELNALVTSLEERIKKLEQKN